MGDATRRCCRVPESHLHFPRDPTQKKTFPGETLFSCLSFPTQYVHIHTPFCLFDAACPSAVGHTARVPHSNANFSCDHRNKRWPSFLFFSFREEVLPGVTFPPVSRPDVMSFFLPILNMVQSADACCFSWALMVITDSL